MTPDWDALHQDIQVELAGYVDGELLPRDRERLEAHLAGCAACRADVARQRALAARLGALGREEPVPARLRQTLVELPSRSRLGGAPRWPRRPRLPAAWLAAAGWGVAAVLALVLVLPGGERAGDVPMVDDVLADYRQALARPLPPPVGRTAPVPLFGGRLLATWQLTVGGQPATAFALRRGGRLIVQYQVTEEVFFRQPAVREAVAREGRYQERRDDTLVVALPTPRAGALVVGPADALTGPEVL